MGSFKDVKDTKAFCDEVYTGLDEIKRKVVAMRRHVDKTYGENSYVHNMYDRHLAEVADEIDWKIQILAHSCPYDWKGSASFEGDVQVNESAKSKEGEFSPGYVGG